MENNLGKWRLAMPREPEPRRYLLTGARGEDHVGGAAS